MTTMLNQATPTDFASLRRKYFFARPHVVPRSKPLYGRHTKIGINDERIRPFVVGAGSCACPSTERPQGVAPTRKSKSWCVTYIGMRTTSAVVWLN